MMISKSPRALSTRKSGSIKAEKRGLLLEQLEARTVLSSLAGGAPDQPRLTVDPQEYDAASVLVRFRPGAASGKADKLDDIFPGASHGRSYASVPGLELVHLPQDKGVDAALKAFRSNPNVLYAEPNYRVHANLTPNDPDFGSLYGMDKIDAPEAWDIGQGSSNIVVGVIDTGIDYNHPDLAGNIWTNAAEASGAAGVDDDGNGFVDDIHGYDFVNGDGDPFDDHYHGTHTSGTIGAVGNNGVGVAGVNWDVSLMGLKFLDAGGSGSTADAIAAVDYATLMRSRGVNIRVTSNSWGGGGFDQGLLDAINAAGDAGILFVAAAGNDGSDNDSSPFYPASYDSPYLISVAATDSSDNLAGFSNFGASSVDLGAPGVDTLSTVPGGGYDLLSGTSMATPHVSGVAALAWSLDATATPAQIRSCLLDSVDPLASLAGITVSGGRLNARSTLECVGMTVAGSAPAAGSTVAAAPADFVINFSHPYNTGPGGNVVDASDLTVNGLTPDSVVLNDSDTATFHFNTPPLPAASLPTGQGEWTMHMAAGVVDAAAGSGLPDPANKEWTARFRFDLLPLAVTATAPASGSAVTLPFTTLDVNLNEPVLPGSVQKEDLVINQGAVTDASVLPGGTTIRFTLGGIINEGTLTAAIAGGALTDAFGNPNVGFSGSYTLDIGTVAFPPLTPVAPLGSLIYDPQVTGFIDPPGDQDRFTINIDAGQTLTIVAHPAPPTEVLWVGPHSLEWNDGSLGVTQISVGEFSTHSLAGYNLIYVDASAGGLSILQSRAGDIAAFVSAGGGLITDVGGNFDAPDFSWTPHGGDLDWVAEHQDSIELTALGNTHPVTAGLTDAGLSNWGNSQHSYFVATAGLSVLATNPSGDADILAGTYGAGRVVYLGLDPSYHQPVGDSAQLIRQAVQWAKGIPAAPFAFDLKLRDPSNNVIGTPEVVGDQVIIQTAGPTVAGTYTVEVGATGGAGRYTVEAILNAAVERESHGGAANNSPAAAQNINGSFIPLLKGATRGAVLGRTDATNPTTTLFSTNFESGTGGFGVTGLWHSSIGHGTEGGHSATHSLYFGTGEKYAQKGKGPTTFTKGTYEVKSKGKVQAVSGAATSPNITLPAGGQITVDFNYLLQTQGSTTLDLAQLQIKPSGSSTWTTLAAYNGVAESSLWRAAAPVDISAFSGQTVQLRFNFDTVNNVSNNFEGWYVDDLFVRQTLPHDNYSFSAPGGQNVTVALEALTPGSLNVLLQNAAGTATLASGAAGAANVDRMIYNFGPLAAGTYNLAVVGATNTDYSLIVTQGAVFDRELNDTAASAQPFSPPPVALGSVGTKEIVTLSAIDAGWYDNTGFHDPTNTNYVAGYCCEPAEHRNFFVFNLAGISRKIASAELRVLTPSGGFASDSGSETYQLFDISTSVAALQAGGTGKTAIYSDLGSGVSYASRVVTAADDGQVLALPLSAAAVANLNASLGGTTALGGGVTSISGAADQVIFGYSGNPSDVQLVIALEDAADYYSFAATVGQHIDLFTATPGAAPAQPGNNLNPHLRLLNPAGSEVGTRTVLDAQGNERIVFDVPTGGAGTYKVEVTAEGGTSGDYILDPDVSSLAPSFVPLASAGEAKTKKATSLAAKPPATAALPPASVDRVLAASTLGKSRTALVPRPKTDIESLIDALVHAHRPMRLAEWLQSRR